MGHVQPWTHCEVEQSLDGQRRLFPPTQKNKIKDSACLPSCSAVNSMAGCIPPKRR